MAGDIDLSLERIEAALKTVAYLISNDGDVYWPVFERLEEERDRRLKRASRLQSYLE